MTSDLEPESPEIRQEFPLNNLEQVLETWCAPLELAPSAGMIASAQHRQTPTDPRHRRFYGTAGGERRLQFRYRTADISVGISLEFSRELRHARKGRVDVIQLSVHRGLLQFAPSPPSECRCCATAFDQRQENDRDAAPSRFMTRNWATRVRRLPEPAAAVRA
jgi:hypothetical protein